MTTKSNQGLAFFYFHVDCRDVATDKMIELVTERGSTSCKLPNKPGESYDNAPSRTAMVLCAEKAAELGFMVPSKENGGVRLSQY